jgi:predicted metal-binding membrane protein
MTADARRSDRRFVAAAALVFVASAVVTVAWCGSMPAHCAVAMPGGWTLSMTWMRMPGQSWPGAAAAFLAMWAVMMTAMMVPVLAPMLRPFRDAVADGGPERLGRLTVLAGAGYFAVWLLLGVVIFPIGASLAGLALAHPAVAHAIPTAAGIIVVAAGALQWTAWKARHLACCREAERHRRPGRADAAAAWSYGVRIGVHCLASSAGFTAILLVTGVMDLRAMTVVGAAVAAERLAPAGDRMARALGTITVAAGAMLIARAAWLP